MEARVGPPLISIHHDDHILVCEPNARMSRKFGQGYFVADTRLASGYRLRIEGLPPTLLNSSAVRSHSHAFSRSGLPNAFKKYESTFESGNCSARQPSG